MEELQTIESNLVTISVTDQDTLEQGRDIIKSLKDQKAVVIDYWSNPKKQAHDAWKSIVAKEKEMTDRIDGVITEQTGLINTFLQIEERKRIQAEQLARIEAERLANDEKARLEKLAKKEEKKGNLDLAQELREEKSSVVAIAEKVQTTFDQVGGLHTRQDVEVEVVDLDLFIRSLVKEKKSLAMIDVKKAVLKSWVKSNGIEYFSGLKIVKSKKAVIR
jgi:hypothetical protein